MALFATIAGATLDTLFQSTEEYAEKILPLLLSPNIENYSGAMFNRFGDPIYSNPFLQQKANVKRLIEESEKLMKKGLD